MGSTLSARRDGAYAPTSAMVKNKNEIAPPAPRARSARLFVP